MFDEADEGHAEDEETLVFHYNRRERLKNAPKNVQNYYDGTFRLNKGFFRVLVATKMNRIMLLMVGFCLAIVFLVQAFGNRPEISTVGGFEVELSSFSYDESIYSSLKIHPLKKSLMDEDFVKQIPSVSCMARFDFYDGDQQLVESVDQEEILRNGETFIRTMITDYDIINVACNIQILGESTSVKTRIKKRE